MVKRKTATLGTDDRKQGQRRESGLRLKIQESFRKELNILGLADSVRVCEGGENRDWIRARNVQAEMRVKVKKDDLEVLSFCSK